MQELYFILRYWSWFNKPSNSDRGEISIIDFKNDELFIQNKTDANYFPDNVFFTV